MCSKDTAMTIESRRRVCFAHGFDHIDGLLAAAYIFRSRGVYRLTFHVVEKHTGVMMRVGL